MCASRQTRPMPQDSPQKRLYIARICHSKITISKKGSTKRNFNWKVPRGSICSRIVRCNWCIDGSRVRQNPRTMNKNTVERFQPWGSVSSPLPRFPQQMLAKLEQRNKKRNSEYKTKEKESLRNGILQLWCEVYRSLPIFFALVNRGGYGRRTSKDKQFPRTGTFSRSRCSIFRGDVRAEKVFCRFREGIFAVSISIFPVSFWRVIDLIHLSESFTQS